MDHGEETNRKIFQEIIIMANKKECKNIIKIQGYSIKFNKLGQIARIYILMDLYMNSLRGVMDDEEIFLSDEQKLEVSIQICVGLIELHSG
jgi:hypothetical protein